MGTTSRRKVLEKRQEQCRDIMCFVRLRMLFPILLTIDTAFARRTFPSLISECLMGVGQYVLLHGEGVTGHSILSLRLHFCQIRS